MWLVLKFQDFSVVFLTALLRYSSHIIQFTHLNSTIPWLLPSSAQAVSNIFIIQRRNHIPLSHHPNTPSLPAKAVTNLHFVSLDLLILDISYKWNQIICGPLQLAFQLAYFQGSCHRMYQNFILTYCGIIFHWVDNTTFCLFVYQSMACGLLPHFG